MRRQLRRYLDLCNRIACVQTRRHDLYESLHPHASAVDAFPAPTAIHHVASILDQLVPELRFLCTRTAAVLSGFDELARRALETPDVASTAVLQTKPHGRYDLAIVTMPHNVSVTLRYDVTSRGEMWRREVTNQLTPWGDPLAVYDLLDCGGYTAARSGSSMRHARAIHQAGCFWSTRVRWPHRTGGDRALLPAFYRLWWRRVLCRLAFRLPGPFEPGKSHGRGIEWVAGEGFGEREAAIFRALGESRRR